MECGCVTTVDHDVVHCPKHAAADDMLAALAWALPYLAEVPLPADNQRHRDWYAKKLNTAEEAVRAARGGA
jgi:hypothetical protein